MKQVVQFQKNGKISVEDLPPPLLKPGFVLVRNSASVISAGTERQSLKTAQASLLGKARSRPDLVQQVLANIRREGVWATIQKVRNRLESYKELGYSSAGVVVASDIPKFPPGTRVACAGAGYAVHAEYIAVPKNLVCKIPESVSFEEAAFTTLGAIALQGVRQAKPQIGDRVLVIGLGLLGLLTVQLLKANGCRVAGVDISEQNFQYAYSLGCDACFHVAPDTLEHIAAFTNGIGVDATIITASTQSSQPVHLALEATRKRGTVVIVGVVGMELPRSPFYEKELNVTIACSYGPGRYDPLYEEFGIDYPIGYVRWTENRNMQAFLELLAQKKVQVEPLITHRFPIENALDAYHIISGDRKEPYLGIVLTYPTGENHQEQKRIAVANVHVQRRSASPLSIGFIGAGNFAQSVLLPPLARQKAVTLAGVATARPINAKGVAEKFGFRYATTDPAEVLQDPNINVVFIASRHDSHAQYVLEALKAGKHVFVEKPLAITEEQLEQIIALYREVRSRGLLLMVGFNRRFSAPFQDIAQFFSAVQDPLLIHYRVHAGKFPADHWLLAPDQGGRILGEACHFVDTIAYLSRSFVREVTASIVEIDRHDYPEDENIAVILRFANGAIGNLLYLSNGDNKVPKEYCEVFGGGKTAMMQNFQYTEFYSGRRKRKRYNGRKGHEEEIEHFVKVLLGEEQPRFSFESYVNTTRTMFAIHRSLHVGTAIEVENGSSKTS